MRQPADETKQLRPAVPLEYARPLTRGRGKRRRYVITIVVSMMASAVLAAFLLPSISRPRYAAYRVKCASNMRQIGQGIETYANNCGGRFPDDLGSLYVAQDLSASVFLCPNSNDTPVAPPPTTQATAAALQATAAALLQPGHCSYTYLGKGLSDQTVTPDMVLLYEPLINHGGDGMNVMFGDFHVEWLPASDAQTILNQVAARTRTVRFPATLPTSLPAAGR